MHGSSVGGSLYEKTMKIGIYKIKAEMATVSTTVVNGTGNDFLLRPGHASPRSMTHGQQPDDPCYLGTPLLSSRFQTLVGEHAPPSGSRT